MDYWTKPNDMTWTDCAIYVDANHDDPDPNVQLKIFEYLYHLFNINAYKRNLFWDADERGEFSLYAATRLYMLYQRKKENPGAKPIKSCVNYIKRVLYPLRADYCKSRYDQVFQERCADDEDADVNAGIGNIRRKPLSPEEKKNMEKTLTAIRADKLKAIERANNGILQAEYAIYIEEIPVTMKGCLKNSPYSGNKVTIHNIYLSCLLSFLKLTTLSNANRERIEYRENKSLPTADLIDQMYAEEYADSLVVWHLDKSMTNYIAVMTNLMRKEIAKDLRYIIGSNELPESVLKDMLNNSDNVTDYEHGEI